MLREDYYEKEEDFNFSHIYENENPETIRTITYASGAMARPMIVYVRAIQAFLNSPSSPWAEKSLNPIKIIEPMATIAYAEIK